MTFSYSFNAGKLNTSNFDKNYLQQAFGFSANALAFDNASSPNYLLNIGTLSTEYQAKFGKTLAISDDYKLFENDTMDYFLNTSEINYTSLTATSRTEAYKEMFLEKFKPEVATNTNLTITNSSTAYNTAHYNAGSLSLNPMSFVSTNPQAKTNLTTLYNQLETEANLLAEGLHSSELAYGGYPEIGYSSIDAELALLNKQLESEMQNFVKLYDDLVAHYKIKSDNSVSASQREKEATTAATMTSVLALEYAQKYYSQSIKPTAPEYIFGQAALTLRDRPSTPYTIGYFVGATQVQGPGVEDWTVNQAGEPEFLGYIYTNLNGSSFSTTDGYDEKYNYNNTWNATPPAFIDGTTQPGQNTIFSNLIDPYSEKDADDFTDILYDNQSGYTMFNQVTSNPDNDYMWDMGTNPVRAVAEPLLSNAGEIGAGSKDYINWMVRDSFGVGGLTADIANTDYCSDSATFIATGIIAAAQKLVDLKMKIQIKTIESSINNQIRAEYEARIGAMQAIQETLASCTGNDPYKIEIDGQKYMLGQDKNDDGTINNITEILGIRDTQENLFESLKNLDTNNDGYVSQEEMKAHNIILNAVDNESGQLKNAGYDMSLVKGINLAELQSANGQNNIFGKFTMDLQNKKVNGDLTFEDKSYFDNLFASVVDFSILDSIEDEKSMDAISIPSSIKPEQEVEATKEEAPVKEEAKAEEKPEVKEFSLFDAKNFSFDFVGAEDNKSAFEKLLDQLSWQMNITNLTNTQRYNILDSLEANQDVSLAKAEIQQELEKINLSA